MAIQLTQDMAILTIVGGRKLPDSLIGKKAVFSLNQNINNDLPLSWLLGPMQVLAAKSLETGEFGIESIYNPLQHGQEVSVMVDPFLPPSELILLGGGHVAKSLGELGYLLGYRLIVVDDREEFVAADRFPHAYKRIHCSFDQLKENISPGARSSVVIVTRGHQHDWNCLHQMLEYQVQYLGVIGSRRKIGMLRERMITEGFSDNDINRVYMPIGIDIGAQTPEEIAVSIAAELIKVRRGGKAASMKGGEDKPVISHAAELTTTAEINVIEKAIETAQNGIPAALATITFSTGSTPRKAGSRMLVFQDGSIFGTIGGGLGEAQITKEAVKIISTGVAQICTVTMTAENAAQEGMVCGGNIEVFVEPVTELGRVFGERR